MREQAARSSVGGQGLDRRALIGGLGAAAVAAPFIGAATAQAAQAAQTPGALALPSAMEAPQALALKTFSRIDGTPVYYWRSNRGNTSLRNWQCTQAFYDRLVVWIRDLRSLSGADVAFLVSAGFYVNKSGQHGQGTAMDLDLVRWAGGRQSSPLDRHHAASNRTLRRRYLAVDAVCRRRFRYVLDGWYNSAHADHIHADFGGLPTVCNKGSRSDAVFVQAMCNNFMGSGLAVDGAWGPLTQAAFDRAKSRLGITGNPHTDYSVWRTMMARVARHGFADQAF
jgi:hypothetical protein